MNYGPIVRNAYYAYVGASMGLFSRYPPGTNVFERDWDVMVLLDTCRVDALRAVADEYDFISTVDRHMSVGSGSSEWIASTFREEYEDEIANTAYISANAFAQYVLEERNFPDDGRGPSWSNWKTVSADDFGLLDQPWRYGPDNSLGHPYPEVVTDRAIQVARENSYDRIILHYSQPHHPYTAIAREEGRESLEPHESEPFAWLRQGGDFDLVWNAYIENLRFVLDSVELLLNNVDAEKVVLSADHGEAFGEYGVYKHPLGLIHPNIRWVPWAETTATDSGEYEPELERPEDQTSDAEEQLKMLGYFE
jgi:hypothetical protein